MNKFKDDNTKKTLVRNSEKPLPKFKVTTINSQLIAPKENNVEHIPKKNSGNVEDTKNKFDSPELYSSLKLAKHIDQIAKPRKTKSCSDVVNKQLAVDEKVSRQVNFPYSQPIYKDLIPLTCSIVPQQPGVSSRDPLLKDKEPVLSDFTTSQSMPNYYSLPNVKLEIQHTLITNNNLRLYSQLEMNRNM